jgi:hypothetical protein
MARRKAMAIEASEFIRAMLAKRDITQAQLQWIVDEVFPFSWKKYCDRSNITDKIKDWEVTKP